MSNSKSLRTKTFKLTEMALLIAIIVVMAFTPLGYLKTAGVEITFITIPVVVGAIILGPAAGAFLGGIFGLTSFIQCFGMSAFGVALFEISPISTFIVCMIPRILMGWLTGLVFKALQKIDKTKLISYTMASLCGPLFNTVLFTGGFILLFGHSDYFLSLEKLFGSKSIFSFIAAFVGVNGLIEAITCFVIGTAISKALTVFLGKLKVD